MAKEATSTERSLKEKLISTHEDNAKLGARVAQLEAEVEEGKLSQRNFQEEAARLSKDNAMLRARAGKSKVDADAGKISRHISVDGLSPVKNPSETDRGTAEDSGKAFSIKEETGKLDLVELMSEKMNEILSDFTERIQPIIKAEVLKTLEGPGMTRQPQSYARIVGNFNKSSEGPERRSSESSLARGGTSDERAFPLLQSRNNGGRKRIDSSTPRKGNDCRSLSSPIMVGVNRKSSMKRSEEEIVVLHIKDVSRDSYNAVLLDCRKHISLENDVGVSSVRVRKTANGETILAISGQDAARKADIFVTHISKLLPKYNGNVTVSRVPEKVDITLSGSNEFTSDEEIIEAIASHGGCKIEDITLGSLSHRSFGR